MARRLFQLKLGSWKIAGKPRSKVSWKINGIDGIDKILSSSSCLNLCPPEFTFTFLFANRAALIAILRPTFIGAMTQLKDMSMPFAGKLLQLRITNYELRIWLKLCIL